MACNHKDIAEYIIENYDVEFKILDNSAILIYDDVSELKIEYSNNWISYEFNTDKPIDIEIKDSIVCSTTAVSGGLNNETFIFAIEAMEKFINFNARTQPEKLN